ncbi:hypothetical protein [Cryptosporangium aurantiacum]|uniref:PH domain-containing protein n=1 Tax=Cryptosporangium aurantiacum TaxID=134849 RepID=A0A1M7QTH1_9ACTN|nr:hypothetical protein [Cryptosporangium aurantiacum]SHN34987.1 hypothetical protein SAMN05443668_105332 [Cryptosporangium aurantiacum]
MTLVVIIALKESGLQLTQRALAGYGVGLLFVALHVAAFWRVSRRRPSAFLLGHHRGRPVFLAATRPIDHALLPMFTGIAAGFLTFDPDPFVSPGVRAALIGASALFAGGIFGCAVWLTLFRRPFLTLSTDGLAVRWSNGPVQGLIRALAWDALAPGGPPLPPQNARTIWLRVQPALPPVPGVAAPGWFRVEARWMFVDPCFLAHAIHYYREHPEARDGIGTPEGHAQLSATLPRLR